MSSTKLLFREVGSDDSFGMYLDDVSVVAVDIDQDDDGVLDDEDNCSFVPNPEQEDMDEDGIGDACDYDIDGDGVLNTNDKCEGTLEADEPYNELGVNRHVWYGGDQFTTKVPAKKGQFNSVESEFTLADTYGCSCEQILDVMSGLELGEFEGHYKYGCSKSIIQDWISGRYHVGLVPFETVTVSGTTDSVTSGVNETEEGTEYELTASGTYTFAPWTGAGIADASCSLRIPGSYNDTGDIAWIMGSSLPSPYTNYLELWVNGVPASWGACNSDNVYTKTFVGNGLPFNFNILDNYYRDNVGSLTVEIREDKWVDLW